MANPVKVALVRFVAAVRTKSSAASISILPGDKGREAIAILPSGSPVPKKKVLPARAGSAMTLATRSMGASQKFARTVFSYRKV
jgi:hypothetical protein